MTSILSAARASRRRIWRAALLFALAGANAAAQDLRAKTTSADHSADNEIARYCSALAPSASEARAAYQLRRLGELEGDVREAVEKLEKEEAVARDWVTKREEMMKAATDDVVAIYTKMAPEAAAAEMAAMDDSVAAAVLAKLNARAASAILSEMPPEKAAKLSSVLAGAPMADKS